MEAKQIENQINANQNEAMRIQSQLLQMDFSNPQYQPLSNRLTIINRAQTYWSNEYVRLTGKELLPPLRQPSRLLLLRHLRQHQIPSNQSPQLWKNGKKCV